MGYELLASPNLRDWSAVANRYGNGRPWRCPLVLETKAPPANGKPMPAPLQAESPILPTAVLTLERNNSGKLEDQALAGEINATTLGAVTAMDVGAINRGVKMANFAVIKDGEINNGNTRNRHPVKACLVEVEFLSNETAMGIVRLPGAMGGAIMVSFSAGAANNILEDILNQQ